jgi:hypothetical protein
MTVDCVFTVEVFAAVTGGEEADDDGGYAAENFWNYFGPLSVVCMEYDGPDGLDGCRGRRERCGSGAAAWDGGKGGEC